MALSQRTIIIIGLMCVLILAVSGCASATPSAPPNVAASETTTPRASNPSTSETPRGPRGPSPSGDASSGQPTASPTAAAPGRVTPNQIKATGNLLSANQATIAFQASGRVKEIKVKEGDRVQAGALIAALDTTALDATILQTQSALDSANANLAKVKAGPTPEDIAIAKSNLDRAQAAVIQAQTAYDRIGGASNPTSGLTQQALTLQQNTSAYQAAVAQYNLAVNHPTPSELKAAEATVAQAQAALEAAKLAAANARIVAPFDGTVIFIGVKVSESAVAGTAAITLADLARMQAQVNVDEFSVGSLQVGQPATITIDAVAGKPSTGRVSKIGMLATTTGNIVSIPVTVDIDGASAGIYPGLSATVTFTARP